MKRDSRGKRFLAAAGCILVYLLVLAGGALMVFWMYDRLFGAGSAYAVENTPWLICAGVPALLFLGIMVRELILLGGAEPDVEQTREEKRMSGLDSVQMMGVTAVFLMLLVAAHFMAGLCVDQIDEDGVSKYMIRRGIHYSWQDADHYRIEEKGGEIRITIVMDNDKEFCYGNGWFGISSDAFAEKFPNDTYDFWPYAAVEMKKNGVKAEADWELLEGTLTEEADLELIRTLKEINETAYYL